GRAHEAPMSGDEDARSGVQVALPVPVETGASAFYQGCSKPRRNHREDIVSPRSSRPAATGTPGWRKTSVFERLRWHDVYDAKHFESFRELRLACVDMSSTASRNVEAPSSSSLPSSRGPGAEEWPAR